MLARIAAFEVRYQLRAPLFAVGFAIFFLLTFGSVTIDEIQIGGRGNVNVNSPFAIVQTVAIMRVFAVFIVTAFVANVIVRDDETGFAPIMQSTRVSKLDYLVGPLRGATLVAFLVLASRAGRHARGHPGCRGSIRRSSGPFVRGPLPVRALRDRAADALS